MVVSQQNVGDSLISEVQLGPDFLFYASASTPPVLWAQVEALCFQLSRRSVRLCMRPGSGILDRLAVDF